MLVPRWLPAVLLLAACSTPPSPTDASSDASDVTADVPSPCAMVCSTVVMRCTSITMDDCVNGCSAAPTPYPYDAGAGNPTFQPMSCLSTANTCEDFAACLRGPPSSPFAPGPYGTNVRDLAGPFTVPTTMGDWDFHAEWTGNDSYVFLVYAPGLIRDAAGNDYSAQLFQSGGILDIIAASPRNVHYFFIPYRDTMGGLDAWRMTAESDLATLPDADRTWWQSHVHFVTTPVNMLGNWISTMFNARRASHSDMPESAIQWAIDRFQRIREVGQLGTLGMSGSNTIVLADITFVGNEPTYYNFEYDRETRLANEHATVVPVASGQVVASDIMANVTFPDAATMATFDTMEADLTLNCAQHEDGQCGPWDYISNLTLCTADPMNPSGPPVCNTEVARWITTYWREGRWVTDISGLLPLFRDGGVRQMHWYASPQFVTGAQYYVDLSIRLSHHGSATHPSDAQLLWSGDSFHPTTSNPFSRVTVTVPNDVTSVSLYVVYSGHGQNPPRYCAEFCNTQHHFTVNGTDNVIDFPEAGTMLDCSTHVGEGVVPNQHGTWYLGRDGWCPGYDVAPHVVDITSQIHRGAANTIAYRPLVLNAMPTSSSGNADVDVWLLYGR